MNLRDRLRLLKAAGSSRARDAGPLPEPVEAPWPMADPLPAAEGALARPALAGNCLEGWILPTRRGEAFYFESRVPAAACRGPMPLSHVARIPGATWSLLARVDHSVNLEQAVFLDTETTGLAGGSGTYAFLVGLGFFEQDEFVVRQYFLRDYGEEEAMLDALSVDLNRLKVLVTFNGKSFDWPLLETRYRMARRHLPLAGAPHLDLLHPARRIWKERLLRCNLTSLEAEVLGVLREGDVPGFEIPSRYFDYLRSGSGEPLRAVIEHNRLDIISLAALGGWMGRIVQDPFSPTDDGELLCGDDLFGLGRLYESRGLLEDAILCYEAASSRGLRAASERMVQRYLSGAYKRRREHSQALAVWEEMVRTDPDLTLYPWLEMAKYHEHVSRDLQQAYALALRALAVAERRRNLMGAGSKAVREWQEVRHRLGRLERKLGACQEAP